MSRQKLLTIFSGSLFSDNHEYQWTPGNGLTGTWASKTEKQDYLQGKKKESKLSFLKQLLYARQDAEYYIYINVAKSQKT